jgi:hypothetical protein
MSNKLMYNVAPRYTGGSPALVDRETAEAVMEEELDAYSRAMFGVYGEKHREKARRLGLKGIVEHRQTFAHHYIATDEITGETRDSRLLPSFQVGDSVTVVSESTFRGQRGSIVSFIQPGKALVRFDHTHCFELSELQRIR